MAGKGIPSSVPICEVISKLFQNEKIRADVDYDVIFSAVKLSDAQKAQLVYPAGLVSLDLFVLYQTDKLLKGKVVFSYLQLVSFVKGKGGYIYGYYFDVKNQPPFTRCELANSDRRIKLVEGVELVSSKYVEVYNYVDETVVILSLDSGAIPYASLQYAKVCRYHYVELSEQGIVDIAIPETELIGLSDNLSKLF